MPQPNHLVIDPVFDSSVTSSPEAANYEAAVNAAISYLESKISTPITISIGFGYGEVGGNNGSAGTPLAAASGAESQGTTFSYSYADVYAALEATDTTSAVQIAAAASLPKVDPTGSAAGAQPFQVAAPEAMALGLTIGALANGLVGNVGLSVDNYIWSQTGPIGATQQDAVSDLEHEITEIMGRIALAGVGGQYTPLDLFRYTAANGLSGDVPGSAAGVRDDPFVAGYSANAYSYFSYDGHHVTLQYDTPAQVTAGDDVADWELLNGQPDSFDGEGGPGAYYPVSTTDLEELNALGFDEVSTPPPRDNFIDYGLSDFLIQNTSGVVVVSEVAGGSANYVEAATLGTEWSFHGEGHFLADGNEGFLIENTAGAVVVGEIGSSQASYTAISSLGPEWKFEGTGNFLAQTNDQFLIENTSGVVVVGNAATGQAVYTQVATLGPEWSFKETGNFLGDGKSDFLIENTAGAVVVGEVTGATTAYTTVASLGPEWKFVGSGDFLGDGKDDFLMENTAGAVVIGEVVNGTASYTTVTSLGSEWTFVGAGDYLGEGHDQFLIENSAGVVVVGDYANGGIHFAQVGSLGPEWAFH
jgi:hypothetical protein